MKKIGSKIIILQFVFVFVSVILILFISYRTVNNILLEHAFSLGMACAELDAKEIEGWLKEKTNLLESIAVQIENAESNDEGSMQKILGNAVKAEPSVYSFFIGFENGKLLDANGWIPPSNYNTTERPWYREAADANRIIFTSAYIDKKKNAQVKAIAMPLHIRDMNAVLAANIPFDTIRKQIQGIRFGETGYGILLDGDGIILVYPDRNSEMKPLNAVRSDLSLQLQESISKDQKGTAVIRSGKNVELLVHVPIQSNDWKLLLLAPIEEFQGPAKKMTRQLMIIIGLLLGFMTVISYLLGKKVSSPPDSVIEEVESVAGIDVSNEADISAYLKDDGQKLTGSEASTRKERRFSGTEEVYDIAGQIDEIAAHLEKGIQPFKIKKE